MAQRLASAQDDADAMNDAAWIRRHVPEAHNARAALTHCVVAGEVDDMARLVTALAMMDWMLCRQAEILHIGVQLGPLARAAPRLRAGAWLELSWALFSDGDHRLGAELAQAAQALFESLGEPTLAYRALAQHTRLLESLPDMEAEALRAWQQLQARQAVMVPRRSRLFCAVSGGLANRAEMSPERLEVLGREAEHEGFDAIAAIAACNRTDALLVAGRLAEVVTAADQALARHHAAHRACACILLNKTTALIRLGREDDARASAQRAFRLMPSVAPALVDAFALAALRAQRLADAAVLHGCGAHIRERLSRAPDLAEAESVAETVRGLNAGVPASQREELMALGAAMTATEALMIKVFGRAPPPRGVASASSAGPASSADATLAR
jgi:tetratricopeptide (TPR) repeat protein